MVPTTLPAITSIRKCCSKYTLDRLDAIASKPNSKPAYLFLYKSDKKQNNAKAVVACPEGKLCSDLMVTPSTCCSTSNSGKNTLGLGISVVRLISCVIKPDVI